MRNQVKWTPGPWYRATKKDHGRMLAGSVCADDTSGARWVLFQGNPSLSPQEKAANNHLVSAAPDLYEALRKLHSSIGVDDYGNRYANIDDSMANEIENALAKARGES